MFSVDELDQLFQSAQTQNQLTELSPGVTHGAFHTSSVTDAAEDFQKQLCCQGEWKVPTAKGKSSFLAITSQNCSDNLIMDECPQPCNEAKMDSNEMKLWQNKDGSKTTGASKSNFTGTSKFAPGQRNKVHQNLPPMDGQSHKACWVVSSFKKKKQKNPNEETDLTAKDKHQAHLLFLCPLWFHVLH